MNETAHTIRLMIVDGDKDALAAVEQLLVPEHDMQIVGTASSNAEALHIAEQKFPDVALIASGSIGTASLQVSEAIVGHLATVRVVMILSKTQASAEFLQRAMLAGARDFVIRPFDASELIAAIRRSAGPRESVLPMPGANGVQSGAPVVPAAAPAAASGAPPAPVLPAREHPRRGRVFAIYSANGGIGRTTVAINLAVALQMAGSGRVALMDSSLRFGDVGVLLNLRSRRTIGDVVSAGGTVDLSILPDVLATHHSGIKVLLAPASPEFADVLTPRSIELVLAALREQFDYVVVDTFTSLDETILTILDQSDRILLLTTSEVHAVKNTRLFLEVGELLKYPAGKIALVLNQHNPKGRITPKEIEANIAHPVFAVIERDDKIAIEAVQSGQPFVITSPKAPISQAIVRIARQLVPAPALPAANPRRGMFGR